MKKKNMTLHFISLCVLCIGFILCRYVLLEFHGMKDWPCYLFLFGLIVLGISFLAKTKLVPIFTSFSYIIGFVVGALLQTDGMDGGGGKTNNLWLIWSIVFICGVIASVLGEIVKKRFSKE